jgi:hypothetical protein
MDDFPAPPPAGAPSLPARRHDEPPRRATLRLLGALGAAGLGGAGCGGGTDLAGVGSGGTGQVAGSFASGTISGFGSVIVNGVRWDDSAARVTDDAGRPRALSQLAIGMVVEIEGRADDGATQGVADRIRVVAELKGPIESIDAAARRFVVLGVTVAIGQATAFEDGLGFASLAVGDALEIHGFADRGAGVLRATLVERRDASDPAPAYRLRGTLAAFDAASVGFRIGALTIDARGATVEPAGTALRNGQLVRLEGARAPDAAGWRVDRVIVLSTPALGTVANARIDGEVAAFESIARFEVAGVPVDASGAVLAGGVAASVRNGARVRVTGPVVAGRLVARTLQIRDDGASTEDDEAEFTGTIVRFVGVADFTVRDAAGRSFIVDASSATFAGGGTASDLRAGVVVEVRGLRRTLVVATRIKFER